MALRSLVLAMLDRCLEVEDWHNAAAILDAGTSHWCLHPHLSTFLNRRSLLLRSFAR